MNMRRLRSILKSQLNGRNKTTAINVQVAAILRYGAGIIEWRELELKAFDRKSGKTMTMYEAFIQRAMYTDSNFQEKREGEVYLVQWKV